MWIEKTLEILKLSEKENDNVNVLLLFAKSFKKEFEKTRLYMLCK